VDHQLNHIPIYQGFWHNINIHSLNRENNFVNNIHMMRNVIPVFVWFKFLNVLKQQQQYIPIRFTLPVLFSFCLVIGLFS